MTPTFELNYKSIRLTESIPETSEMGSHLKCACVYVCIVYTPFSDSYGEDLDNLNYLNFKELEY